MQMIEGVLRILFSLLDRIVIILTNLSYNLLVKISSLNIVDMDVIEGFNKRLGLILGIFMLFNIAVQILNYIVSPDKISDKGNGNAGKLILNIVLSLALLVTVNHIFTAAYKVQFKILEKQIIPQLVFGTKPTTQKLDHYAGEISYYVYSAMMPINTKVTENCSDVYITGIKGECGDSLKTILGNDTFNKFKSVIESKDASEFMDYDIMNAKYEGKYVFDYTLLFSTVIGVIVFLILVGFCIDVATRSIKLYFYQVIAPVPIIANMVPGKGQETFKKWYKACISTYLDVFIRLIALFFATFMIITVVNSLGTSLSGHPFLTVFIILGALIFAKQIPQIIQDLTGIKLDGQFSLNPLKKIENQALFGGLAGVGAAGAAAGLTNFIATKGGFGARLGSAIAGTTSATARGTIAALRGQKIGQVFSSAYSGSNKARVNRDIRNKYDIGFGSTMINRLQRNMGIDTAAEAQDTKVKLYDEFVSSGEAIVSISESEIQKHANEIQLGVGSIEKGKGYAASYNTLGELRAAMEDTSRPAEERAALNAEYERLKGQAEARYRELVAQGGSAALSSSDEFGGGIIKANDVNGEIARSHVENINELFNRNKEEFISSKVATFDSNTGQYSVLGNIKDSTKNAKYESVSTKNSAEYRQAHKVQEQTNREKK